MSNLWDHSEPQKVEGDLFHPVGTYLPPAQLPPMHITFSITHTDTNIYPQKEIKPKFKLNKEQKKELYNDMRTHFKTVKKDIIISTLKECKYDRIKCLDKIQEMLIDHHINHSMFVSNMR